MIFQREHTIGYDAACLRCEEAIRRAKAYGFTHAIFQICNYMDMRYKGKPEQIHACSIDTLIKILADPKYNELSQTRISYVNSYKSSILHPIGRYGCEIMFTKDFKAAKDVQEYVKNMEFLGYSPRVSFGFLDK